MLSGKIFICHEEGHVTEGTVPQINAPALDAEFTTTGPGNTARLSYQVNVQRELEVTSTGETSTGPQTRSCRQSLSFSNIGNYTEAGKIEVTRQQTTGLDISSTGFARQINYPFFAYTGYASTSRGLTISGTIDRGKNISTIGEAIFGGSEVDLLAYHQHNRSFQGAAIVSHQNSSGKYTNDARARTSTTSATTEQQVSLSSLKSYDSNNSHGFPSTSVYPVFDRHVKAINGSVFVEGMGLLAFKESGTVASRRFEPPRLPGRGDRDKHMPDFNFNISLNTMD